MKPDGLGLEHFSVDRQALDGVQTDVVGVSPVGGELESPPGCLDARLCIIKVKKESEE